MTVFHIALARWRLVAGDASGATTLAEEAAAVAAGGRVAPDAVAELHLLRAALAADPAGAARQRAAALAAHGEGDWLAWRTQSVLYGGLLHAYFLDLLLIVTAR